MNWNTWNNRWNTCKCSSSFVEQVEHGIARVFLLSQAQRSNTARNFGYSTCSIEQALMVLNHYVCGNVFRV